MATYNEISQSTVSAHHVMFMHCSWQAHSFKYRYNSLTSIVNITHAAETLVLMKMGSDMSA